MAVNWVSNLLGGGIAATVESFDELFTSDEERAQAEAVMVKLRQRPALLQVELNKIEAQHRSVFVAGWRPFIGWVCGLGLAFTFLVNPAIQWLTGRSGPSLPSDIMLELVIGMLGFGALRTVEKLSGKTK